VSPIANDLSHLPRPTGRTEGEPPDTTPRFVQLLVERMAAADAASGEKPTAFGTRLRHSDAGKCARALGYSAAGIPKSNPMDLAGTWVTSLGTLIHEAWQEALAERYPDALIEPKLRIEGLDASGHADAVIVTIAGEDGARWTILFELKTVGGFSYKMKVGERGAPEGPSHEHRAQAALNAVAVDADEVVIGYIATEAISRPVAERKGFDELTRFVAEWSYTRDDFEPVAAAERARLQGILDLVDLGMLPARKIPSPELPRGAEIVDPVKGRWEQRDRDGQVIDTGTFWACGYCGWQDACAATKAGRIPITDVAVDLGGAA
jgi:hypothetical protein